MTCPGDVSPSAVTALHITSNSAVVRGRSFKAASTTNDLLVDGGVLTPTVSLGGFMEQSKFSAPAGFFANPNLVMTFRDPSEDDESFQVYAELHVGSAEQGKETVLGQGDSYTRGMVVIQARNATAGSDGTNFVDLSAAARSPGGSTFGFATGAVNDAIYVASTLGNLAGPLRHFGHRVSQTVAMIGGAVALEYWNGSAWVAIPAFSTEAQAPYTPGSNDIFRSATPTQIRAGILTAGMLGVAGTALTPTPWATKVLAGYPGLYYWLRYRITSGPGTLPVFEQFKLHTSRFEVNENGFVEWYGEARRRDQLLVHQRLTDDLQGASPGNNAITFANGLVITPIDNNFQNGQTDGFGFIIQIPFGVDPSLPMMLRLAYVPSNNNALNIRFETEYRIISEGDILSAAASPIVISETVAAPGTNNMFTFYEVVLDISGATPGSSYIAVGLQRLGSDAADTFTGNVRVVSLQAFGFIWALK